MGCTKLNQKYIKEKITGKKEKIKANKLVKKSQKRILKMQIRNQIGSVQLISKVEKLRFS